jgi:hypothetical protein
MPERRKPPKPFVNGTNPQGTTKWKMETYEPKWNYFMSNCGGRWAIWRIASPETIAPQNAPKVAGD